MGISFYFCVFTALILTECYGFKAPKKVKLRAKSSNEVYLCWDPPNERAGQAQGYEIDWSIDNRKQDLLKIYHNHCHTFSNLKPKQAIKAAVRAYFVSHRNGVRNYSGPFSKTVQINVPHDKTDEYCVPSFGIKVAKCDFKFNVSGPNSVSITWNSKTLRRKRRVRSVTFFALTTDPPFAKEYSDLVNVKKGYARITNLKPYTEYILGVMVKRKKISVEIGSFRTWPSAPNINFFHGSALSSKAIGLEWMEPNPTNGILQPYEIKCFAPDGKVFWPINPISNKTSSALIVSLQPHTEYKCTLIASAIANEGQQPEECRKRMVLEPIRTFSVDPPPPMNVQLEAINYHMAHLNWDNAIFNGKKVQSYVVYWSIDYEKQDPVVILRKNSHIFTGLAPGQSISATVRAIPVWQFYHELKYAGLISEEAHVTMPDEESE